MIRAVGVETLLHRACGDMKRLPPGGHLDGFEIELLGSPRPDQRFNFVDDLDLEDRREAPFLAASAEAA